MTARFAAAAAGLCLIAGSAVALVRIGWPT